MSVALIAGEGLLPEVIAERMASAGERPVVYALRENVDELAPHVEDIVPVFRTELRAALGDMARRGVRRVMFAGLVPKTLMFNAAMQDEMTREFLAGLSSRDDHTLLGGVVRIFEAAGFEVIGYKDILGDLLATSGPIAGRTMNAAEAEDVEYGIGIARVVVPLSFGQSVIVNKKSVVAVEAMEGTDATIVRAGSICKAGALVKMMKPGQDARYDVPTVGPQTLNLMARAGLTCLALHAGHTLIMAKGVFMDLAVERGISVVGFEG
ncbi:UDP-2,3-diacylglucosamine diphosphatase LpxI [Synergistaceae bacterium OttesenSCG-928-I11]|nr:UDP-2,3-diacylglucosamine diphosphatase LpxI [Synergistaceae bacterium OttesenSCG-928-I11]